MGHWLIKSEPDAYSWDQQVKDSTGAWTGVRNHAAKLNLQAMKVGDRAFFYHSNEGREIDGIVEVVKEGYPERAALDRKHKYFDPKSDPARPTWYSVDVQLEKKIDPPITLETLRKHAQGTLSEMLILRRGNRLSVTPVTREEWRFITSLK
jgi:predicted RNA-binding protein with PUA-like domain